MLSRLYRRLPSGLINYQNFKIMSYQKKLTRSKLWFALALFVAFVTSCNDQNQESPQSTATPSSGTTPLATGIGNFQFLALEADKVKDFFNPSGKKCSKIVFRFIYDEDEKKVVSEAFGVVKADKKFILPPTDLTDLKTGINLGKKLKLGDVELTKKMFKDLGPVPNGATHLIFYPLTSDSYTNSVIYKVQWGTASPFTALTIDQIKNLGGQELNPSPPADPCLSGICEED